MRENKKIQRPEVAEENADTARINWLEKNGGWLGDENLKAKWTISIPAPDRNLSCPTTLREAIDAARGLPDSAPTKPTVTPKERKTHSIIDTPEGEVLREPTEAGGGVEAKTDEAIATKAASEFRATNGCRYDPFLTSGKTLLETIILSAIRESRAAAGTKIEG